MPHHTREDHEISMKHGMVRTSADTDMMNDYMNTKATPDQINAWHGRKCIDGNLALVVVILTLTIAIVTQRRLV